MNDKLRSILRTVWIEPRHFFFWLAMLSICGFIAAAGVAFLTGPMLFLAFVALGCILCLVASIPAFILAWIPPVRRLFAWLLLRRFLLLGCLVTLVALFYAIEDWRGRHAWQSYKRAREAKGERFDWASFAPPPVPKEQNFFETPLWSDLHFTETKGTTVRQDPNYSSRIVFSTYGPKADIVPSPGSWAKAQRVDLAAWQGFYHGASNTIRTAILGEKAREAKAFRERYGARYGLKPPSGSTVTSNAPTISSSPAAQAGAATSYPTNYFPVAKEPQTPAADVLLALSKFSTNRQLLIAAAARPQARFWINYDGGFAMLLPHLARLKDASQYLSLHANAALKAGDRETALKDIKLSFRLIEAIHDEPIVISHLVRIAMLHIALQPVWEGLADRQWTDPELSAIASELGKLNFLADYHLAMRGEQACGLWGVDYNRKLWISGPKEMVAPSMDSGLAQVEHLLEWATFRLIPDGWFDQSKLSLCRLHEKYLLPLMGDQDRLVVSTAAIERANSAFGQQGGGPYEVLFRILLRVPYTSPEDLLRNLADFAGKCALAQCSVDLARVACALERYRLATGQFPDTLDALAPRFIAKLPHDVINGQPLKYRRTDDGQFILFSVGLNETDDGGTLGMTKNGGGDFNKGDWVWRYPAR